VSTRTTFKVPESVLVVIHTRELDVLLIERADAPGYWQSVTGSKDTPGEALVDTCIREVAGGDRDRDRLGRGPARPPRRLAARQRLRDLPGLAAPLC
jgi:hypothetical protein